MAKNVNAGRLKKSSGTSGAGQVKFADTPKTNKPRSRFEFHHEAGTAKRK